MPHWLHLSHVRALVVHSIGVEGMLDFPQVTARLRRKSQLLGIEKLSGLSGVLGWAWRGGERLGVLQGDNLWENILGQSSHCSTSHSHWDLAPLLTRDFAVFSPELALTDDRSGRTWNYKTLHHFYRRRGLSALKVVIKDLDLIFFSIIWRLTTLHELNIPYVCNECHV